MWLHYWQTGLGILIRWLFRIGPPWLLVKGSYKKSPSNVKSDQNSLRRERILIKIQGPPSTKSCLDLETLIFSVPWIWDSLKGIHWYPMCKMLLIVSVITVIVSVIKDHHLQLARDKWPLPSSSSCSSPPSSSLSTSKMVTSSLLLRQVTWSRSSSQAQPSGQNAKEVGSRRLRSRNILDGLRKAVGEVMWRRGIFTEDFDRQCNFHKFLGVISLIQLVSSKTLNLVIGPLSHRRQSESDMNSLQSCTKAIFAYFGGRSHWSSFQRGGWGQTD